MNSFPDQSQRGRQDGGGTVVQGVAPPHSIEAEQAVLGAVLLSEKTMYSYVVSDNLKPEDFYRERHRIVFEAMLALWQESEPIDDVTLSERLKSTGRFDEIGGRAAIDELLAAPPAVGAIRQYAKIVKDNALLRRVLATTYEIQASVHAHEHEPREIVERAERSILEVAHGDSTKDFREVSNVLFDEVQRWQKLSTEGIQLTGTPSGFRDLDEITGGFQPGNLIILAARPSMGKCLRAQSLVYDPWSGARRRVDEVVQDIETRGGAWVASLGLDWKLHAVRATRAFRNGVRPILRVATRLGRHVDATANHPLLTIRGWRRIDELEPGDRIAVPRRLPRSHAGQTMPDAELVRLAAMIADGHGTWGQRLEDTCVPDAIFGLCLDQIARFLSVLYGRDRHIYTTISRRLAEDVQHLLLRFGIVAAIRKRSRPLDEGTGKAAWEVRITGQDGMRAFAEKIGDASAAAGSPASHDQHLGMRGVSRPRLAQRGAVLKAPALAESDVWWDEVVSIEPIGEEETYDIEVPELHNFVADDVVVHNSALVTNIAENVALHPDRSKPVALFSLEMSESELAQRFVASQSSIKGDDLRRGRLRDERKWRKVVETAQRFERAPLYIDDSSDISILEIRAKARRLHQQAADGLGLIIVDYLQLMRPDGRTDNRVEQVGQMSRGLKILARELEVPVIALSQLSRGVESRNDKRPLLSDLRESGNIEQDADLVMFIYRDEYYNRETTEALGEAELIIAKHRNGSLGTVEVMFQGEYPRFLNKHREVG